MTVMQIARPGQNRFVPGGHCAVVGLLCLGKVSVLQVGRNQSNHPKFQKAKQAKAEVSFWGLRVVDVYRMCKPHPMDYMLGSQHS